MEWKSLANAIIHDNYVPGTHITIIRCEQCGNPFMNIVLSNGFPLATENSRITITIYSCPECGHRELDCFGTYGLPDYLPETVVPYVGHFFDLWFTMLNFARKLERDYMEEL